MAVMQGCLYLQLQQTFGGKVGVRGCMGTSLNSWIKGGALSVPNWSGMMEARAGA